MKEKINISEGLGSLCKGRSDSIRIADIGFQRESFAASGFNPGNDLFSFLSARLVHDGDRSATRGKFQGNGAANAAASSGDKGGAT